MFIHESPFSLAHLHFFFIHSFFPPSVFSSFPPYLLPSRKENIKKHSQKKWEKRDKEVKEKMAEKQQKRTANIRAKKDEKIKKKVKKMTKKGRLVPGLNAPGV